MNKSIGMMLSVLVASVLLLSSCGTSGKSDITGIVLSTNSINLSVDESYSLSYTLLPDGVSDDGISWKSSDKSIATVDQNGVVKGKTEGETNIVISAPNGVYTTCSVTVSGKSAYDELSNAEQKLVDALVKASKYFYNPGSVEITYANRWGTDSNTWDVKIRAQNKAGGNTIEDYIIHSDGTLEKPLVGHLDVLDENYNYDLINEALREKMK